MLKEHVKKEKVQAHYSQRTAGHEKVPAESSRKKASGSVFHWCSFSQGQFNGMNE